MPTCGCGYIDLEFGETCGLCGHTMSQAPRFYYFSPKENRWIYCRTESHCKKMANEGFKVKKVAFEGSHA